MKRMGLFHRDHDINTSRRKTTRACHYRSCFNLGAAPSDEGQVASDHRGPTNIKDNALNVLLPKPCRAIYKKPAVSQSYTKILLTALMPKKQGPNQAQEPSQTPIPNASLYHTTPCNKEDEKDATKEVIKQRRPKTKDPSIPLPSTYTTPKTNKPKPHPSFPIRRGPADTHRAKHQFAQPTHRFRPFS